MAVARSDCCDSRPLEPLADLLQLLGGERVAATQLVIAPAQRTQPRGTRRGRPACRPRGPRASVRMPRRGRPRGPPGSRRPTGPAGPPASPTPAASESRARRPSPPMLPSSTSSASRPASSCSRTWSCATSAARLRVSAARSCSRARTPASSAARPRAAFPDARTFQLHERCRDAFLLGGSDHQPLAHLGCRIDLLAPGTHESLRLALRLLEPSDIDAQPHLGATSLVVGLITPATRQAGRSGVAVPLASERAQSGFERQHLCPGLVALAPASTAVSSQGAASVSREARSAAAAAASCSRRTSWDAVQVCSRAAVSAARAVPRHRSSATRRAFRAASSAERVPATAARAASSSVRAAPRSDSAAATDTCTAARSRSRSARRARSSRASLPVSRRTTPSSVTSSPRGVVTRQPGGSDPRNASACARSGTQTLRSRSRVT